MQTKQLLLNHAHQCIQPGIDYFNNQLSSSLKTSLSAFKSSRLFCPHKLQKMQPDAASLDCLSAFPFFKAQEIELLKAELPLYLAKTADLDSSIDSLEWWKQNASELPSWASAARKVLIVQPSSAASERIFSLLKSSFGDQQDASLQDYIETSLMLQYNR